MRRVGARFRVTVIAATLALVAMNGCASGEVVPLAGESEVRSATDRELSPADGRAHMPLAVREGPRTETTYAVPHVQLNVSLVPEVDEELRRRIYSLPGVVERETIVSISGTSALWLAEPFELVNPDATLRDREFAHLHPDGSLHAVLPVERARDAITAKWAEFHPWVGSAEMWDGMVMLYTPQDMDELESTWQLVVDSYNFVTGQAVDAGDFA